MRITLLTDFGSADGYVAAMKGAIAEIAPSAFIDDASHTIPFGDIAAAAFALRRYWKMYPAGSVHVVVVDPEVGSERRALAVEADGRFLIGPDNGALGLALKDAEQFRIVQLEVPASAARTFHGRDVFAPAAARLVNGEGIDSLGAVVTDPVWIIVPPPIATASSVLGEVVHVDRFGNLVSNIPVDMLKPEYIATIADTEVRFSGTYAEAADGELLALVNSDNVIEIAVRNGSAALFLKAGRGTALELHAQTTGLTLM